jgi:hypothetical protein
MKLDTDPFTINVIDFDNKEMLILSNQTESAIGKNAVIKDNAPSRMITPKIPEKGGWRINKKKRQSAPVSKSSVKKLLDKYTLCKSNNVFSRFGCTKCPSSSSGPGGHEHRRGPVDYFQPEFILPEPIYRGLRHEKRAQFVQAVRQHDASVICGDDEKLVSRTSHPFMRYKCRWHGS